MKNKERIQIATYIITAIALLGMFYANFTHSSGLFNLLDNNDNVFAGYAFSLGFDLAIIVYVFRGLTSEAIISDIAMFLINCLYYIVKGQLYDTEWTRHDFAYIAGSAAISLVIALVIWSFANVAKSMLNEIAASDDVTPKKGRKSDLDKVRAELAELKNKKQPELFL
jgi:hypothetical protein